MAGRVDRREARTSPIMAQFRRTARINEQLRQEIALMIRDEVRDPRVGLTTITEVETSPELDHARVYVTAHGEEQGVAREFERFAVDFAGEQPELEQPFTAPPEPVDHLRCRL